MKKHGLFFWILLVGSICFMAGSFLGNLPTSWAARNKVIKAHAFQLLDSHGKPRVTIKLNSRDNLMVFMLDSHGKIHDQLEVSPEIVATAKKSAKTIHKFERAMKKLGNIW